MPSGPSRYQRFLSQILRNAVVRKARIDATKHLNTAKSSAQKSLNTAKNTAQRGVNSASRYTQQKVKDGANYTAQQSYQAFKAAQAHLSLTKRIAGLFRFTFNFVRTTKLYRYTKYTLITGTIAKSTYIYTTTFNKEIVVSKSFHRYTNRGNNDYLIADENHNLFRVSESLWFWQWFPTELWSSIKENQKYHITGYGVRIRKLGIYPNIVRVNKPVKRD